MNPFFVRHLLRYYESPPSQSSGKVDSIAPIRVEEKYTRVRQEGRMVTDIRDENGRVISRTYLLDLQPYSAEIIAEATKAAENSKNMATSLSPFSPNAAVATSPLKNANLNIAIQPEINDGSSCIEYSHPKHSLITHDREEEGETRPKVVIFGGGGYVGQSVVSAALMKGWDVVAVNRSGAPHGFSPIAMKGSHLKWVKGDIFNPDGWRSELIGATAAISCVGAFGNNEKMLRVNGKGNAGLVNEACNAGVPKFVYISVAESHLPKFFLKGYYEGKDLAERAVNKHFPYTGVILRPGFIYGRRRVQLPDRILGIPLPIDHIVLPLDKLAIPLKMISESKFVTNASKRLPYMKTFAVPPVSREAVAEAIVDSVMGRLTTNLDNSVSANQIALNYNKTHSTTSSSSST